MTKLRRCIICDQKSPNGSYSSKGFVCKECQSVKGIRHLTFMQEPGATNEPDEPNLDPDWLSYETSKQRP